MFILRIQLCDPHFLWRRCHFCWNQSKVSENDNAFERNKDRLTGFLKCTDFRIATVFKSEKMMDGFINLKEIDSYIFWKVCSYFKSWSKHPLYFKGSSIKDIGNLEGGGVKFYWSCRSKKLTTWGKSVAHFWLTKFWLLFSAHFQTNPTEITWKK